MQVFKSELTCSIDVDDTLVLWRGDTFKPGKGKLEILDATDGSFRYLVPHTRHIEFLKKLHARGYQITVWSHGGWAWAESVVKALQLEEYVAKVESKPIKIVDDKSVEEGIGTSFFIEPIEEDLDE